MSLREAPSGLQAHVVTLPVLGVEITFVANAPEVTAILEGEYGHWQVAAGVTDLARGTKAIVRIVVSEASAPMPRDLAVEYSVPAPDRMEVRCPVAQGVADTTRLESIVHVDRCLLAQPRRLVLGVLEPLTLFLLGGLDRVPLHAACVSRGDVGIVLAGPSGVGKSTLVMAAARRGYTPVADDPVYVQVEPALRVWGRRPNIHLRPDVVTHFPELADVRPTRMPNGKEKLVVDVGGDRRFVDRIGLCLLRREPEGRARLTRIGAVHARELLTERLDPGFDLFRGVVGARVELLAARGAWLLHLGDHPDAAVPLLDEAVAAVEAAG